jgi:AcrR family transcriptional regulator
MPAKKISGNPMGRPREFDKDAALEAAMRVFWKYGYEGASLANLTKAMRINRSSMYVAFGDKEALYRLAFHRYAETALAYLGDALRKPTLREVVEASLRGTVEFLSQPGNPCGCLSVQGALVTGAEATHVKHWMVDFRKRGLVDATKRVQRAQKDGDLDRKVNPADFARYIATLIQGLAIQGASGATKAEMHRMVDVALDFMAS